MSGRGHEGPPNAEDRLILALTRVGGDRNERGPVPADLDRGLNWGTVIERADRQGVLPLVARALALQPPDRIPLSALDAVRSASGESLRTTLGQTAALLEIIQRFERSGIPLLPFKGPTLAFQAYGDLGLRSFSDLDLLVPPDRLPSARAALEAIGYVPSFPASEARRRLLVRRGSHESFERADGTLVEVHWRLAAPISDFGFDYERLWKRVERIEVAGRSVPALPSEDLLSALCIHGTKHAWERLAWICDVAHLVQACPRLDWSLVFHESQRMRSTRIVLLGLHLAAEVGGATLPPEVTKRISADPTLPSLANHVLGSLLKPPRAGAGTLGFHLGTRERWEDKAALALGSLTALNQHDLALIRLPDAALPLYYLTRPLRLAGKSIAHLLGRARR